MLDELFHYSLKQNKLIWNLLFLLFCASFLNHANANEWSLIWNDEFNVTGLPQNSLWNYEVGYLRNGEKQF